MDINKPIVRKHYLGNLGRNSVFKISTPSITVEITGDVTPGNNYKKCTCPVINPEDYETAGEKFDVSAINSAYIGRVNTYLPLVEKNQDISTKKKLTNSEIHFNNQYYGHDTYKIIRAGRLNLSENLNPLSQENHKNHEYEYVSSLSTLNGINSNLFKRPNTFPFNDKENHEVKSCSRDANIDYENSYNVNNLTNFSLDNSDDKNNDQGFVKDENSFLGIMLTENENHNHEVTDFNEKLKNDNMMKNMNSPSRSFDVKNSKKNNLNLMAAEVPIETQNKHKKKNKDINKIECENEYNQTEKFNRASGVGTPEYSKDTLINQNVLKKDSTKQLFNRFTKGQMCTPHYSTTSTKEKKNGYKENPLRSTETMEACNITVRPIAADMYRTFDLYSSKKIPDNRNENSNEESIRYTGRIGVKVRCHNDTDNETEYLDDNHLHSERNNNMSPFIYTHKIPLNTDTYLSSIRLHETLLEFYMGFIGFEGVIIASIPIGLLFTAENIILAIDEKSNSKNFNSRFDFLPSLINCYDKKKKCTHLISEEEQDDAVSSVECQLDFNKINHTTNETRNNSKKSFDI